MKGYEASSITVGLLVASQLFSTIIAGTIQQRIISGHPAVQGQFPWQVILKKDIYDELHCGGSVISPEWVLTAGHCTFKRNSILMVFGSIYLDEYILSMTSDQIFIHPKYNATNLNNDISVIQLPHKLVFSQTVKAIPLVKPSQANNNFLGKIATIAGFGYTDDGDLENSQSLLFATVEIIDRHRCVDEFDDGIVIESTLCAKGYGGSDQSICSGDSGGPLITKTANGKFYQIGINSFVVEDMCTEKYPSGYVRLGSFLDFIANTTGLAVA